MKSVENYLKERDLRLLVSDKQGGFVVMTSGTFGVKAAQALDKNFTQVKKAALRVKSKTISLCKDLGLNKLAKGISDCKGKCLSVFFTAKTHKPGVPFRCIVSENGAWQLNLSRYLQRHLESLELDDPFRVKNSTEIIEFLKDTVNRRCILHRCGRSILFHSPPRAFQGSTGVH